MCCFSIFNIKLTTDKGKLKHPQIANVIIHLLLHSCSSSDQLIRVGGFPCESFILSTKSNITNYDIRVHGLKYKVRSNDEGIGYVK